MPSQTSAQLTIVCWKTAFLYTADEATETDRCTDVNKHGNAFLFGKVAPVGAESGDRRHSSVIVSVVLCAGDVRARRSVSVHV